MQDPEPNAGEEWRPVEGFDQYLVSDQGRVWSRRAGRALKPNLGGNGRPAVRLPNRSDFLIQNLVAVAWHGPRPEGLEVRHLDGDIENNTPSNIAWATHAENMRDQLRHGTHVNARKTCCPNGHPYDVVDVWAGGRGRRCATCRQKQQQQARQRRTALAGPDTEVHVAAVNIGRR